MAHGGQVGMGDAASQALKKAGAALGNSEISKRIQDPNSLRDEFLKCIVARLKGIRSAQLKESAVHRDSRNLERREIYKGEDHQADPGRYRDVARRYLEAARALTAGQLDRGAMILEEATQMEIAAYASVPKHVKEKLGPEESGGSSLPVGLDQIASGAACGRCSLPQGLVLADMIESMDPFIKLRGLGREKRHNWWEEEEEEEEEEDGDDG
jgi:hypothetical protein